MEAREREEMTDKEVMLIMSLANVSEDVARKALDDHETVEEAIDALIPNPVTPGDKYIPQRPKIDTGMSAEQEELCLRGRWLQEKVNAVYSVAHSQTQTQPDLPALAASEVGLPPSSVAEVEIPIASVE